MIVDVVVDAANAEPVAVKAEMLTAMADMVALSPVVEVAVALVGGHSEMQGRKTLDGRGRQAELRVQPVWVGAT